MQQSLIRFSQIATFSLKYINLLQIGLRLKRVFISQLSSAHDYELNVFEPKGNIDFHYTKHMLISTYSHNNLRFEKTTHMGESSFWYSCLLTCHQYYSHLLQLTTTNETNSYKLKNNQNNTHVIRWVSRTLNSIYKLNQLDCHFLYNILHNSILIWFFIGNEHKYQNKRKSKHMITCIRPTFVIVWSES